jgi:hypothetical protein
MDSQKESLDQEVKSNSPASRVAQSKPTSVVGQPLSPGNLSQAQINTNLDRKGSRISIGNSSKRDLIDDEPVKRAVPDLEVRPEEIERNQNMDAIDEQMKSYMSEARVNEMVIDAVKPIVSHFYGDRDVVRDVAARMGKIDDEQEQIRVDLKHHEKYQIMIEELQK